VVVVNDEDVVALDQIIVVNLSKNVVDHQDAEASYQMDRVHDVVASFYTYVDVVVVNYHHDVDYNVVASNPVGLTFVDDGVDSYSRKELYDFFDFFSMKDSYLKLHMLLLLLLMMMRW
jgi:hypothetical protein